MSVQLFLQGKLLGIDEFLYAPAEKDHDHVFTGRSHWISLLSEVLPRALLAELGLSKILLGSSGGGQFLVVLPEEARGGAEAFLEAAAQEIAALSEGALKLLWSMTENLGDWSDVRRRLNEEMDRRRGTPAAGGLSNEPNAAESASPDYFAGQLGMKLRDAESAGWSPGTPGRIRIGEGKHVWSLAGTTESLPFARHAAPSDDGHEPASTSTLAARATGLATWGVLRGDVDNFGIRIRRAQTIEEHIQLSVMYKQFFAGELEVLCSLPEFWRKVTIIYSGGDDFAVYGAWDALILLAREMQRLFHRFTEENLKEFPGAEGKTISMALALAPQLHYPLSVVFQEAGRNLELAKAADKDCVYLLGRTLEWKQLSDAADLKDTVTRLMSEYRASRSFLLGLRSFYYKEAYGHTWHDKETSTQRTWRFQRRFNRILSGARDREFQKLRAH